jgi:hypothetical protein
MKGDSMTTACFNNDFVGLISATRLVAKRKGVSDGEASEYMDIKLSKLGTEIYCIREGEPPLLIGEAWYSPVCDEISSVLSCEWWRRPEVLDSALPGVRWLPSEFAIKWAAAEDDFGLRPPHEAQGTTQEGRDDFADDPRWPDELGIALTAWRAACTQSGSSGKRPGAFIKDWLKTNYPGLSGEAIKRISTIANWDKTPGLGKNR